jgi:hypothetical protein
MPNPIPSTLDQHWIDGFAPLFSPDFQPLPSTLWRFYDVSLLQFLAINAARRRNRRFLQH